MALEAPTLTAPPGKKEASVLLQPLDLGSFITTAAACRVPHTNMIHSLGAVWSAKRLSS